MQVFCNLRASKATARGSRVGPGLVPCKALNDDHTLPKLHTLMIYFGYIVLYSGYIGIMEKKMEATMV